MKEIFIRFDHCTGCKSCELACAVEHSRSKSLYEALSEIPRPKKRIYVEELKGKKVPFLCRHCEDAPCVRSCRTKALSQDPITRLVTHNPDRCIGCWLCSMVCPYGMIGKEEERRIALKCDRCPEKEIPACVSACPTHALMFVEPSDYARVVRNESIASVLRE